MKNALALILLAAAMSWMPRAAADPTAHVVTVRDFSYKPSDLTIQVGEQVQFVNKDDVAHTVTAKDGSFDSKNLDSNATWTYTFTTAGTYTYICTYHPNMVGTITVKAPSQ